MTKARKLFIFSGLIVLIAGLAAGAYFLFKAPAEAEVKEWRNAAGQLHRENDQPAVIKYYDNGEILTEEWYLNGQLHRENGRPALIVYRQNGKIESEAWYLNGRIYNRGIQDNKLQESSRRISTSVSEAIRTSGVEVIPLASAPDPLTPTSDWYGYCIGNVQYSFKLNVQLIADDGKTSDRQGGLTADQTEQAFIVSRACSKSGSADPAQIDVDLSTSVIDLPEQFELLHDRMRILEFGIERVGDNDNLYDIRLKMAVGGDINDEEYDIMVFEFIEHPCAQVAGEAPLPPPLPTRQAACEVDNDSNGTEDGTWTDPSSLTPVADPMNLTSDHIIHKCQSTAIECSVLETRTRVFRRIL